MSLSPFCHNSRLCVLEGVSSSADCCSTTVFACLICSVKLIDILDEFPVEEVQAECPADIRGCTLRSRYICPATWKARMIWNIFSSKESDICFLCTVELVAVKYTLTAAAGRAYISAGVAADAFAQFALEDTQNAPAGLIASIRSTSVKRSCILRYPSTRRSARHRSDAPCPCRHGSGSSIASA